LCISLDVMPTMLDLAGVPVPQGHKLDGISLVPVLLAGQSLGQRQLFWNGVAMRDGPWKLITKAKGAGRGPLLFDLGTDIGEQNNLADQHPDRVQQMLAAIEEWNKDVEAD
jgi:arylsulfatase A-like enzyme